MNLLDLTRLAEGATKFTSGSTIYREDGMVDDTERGFICEMVGNPMSEWNQALGPFVAAANPQMVLRLLAVVKAAEDEARRHADDSEDSCPCSMCAALAALLSPPVYQADGEGAGS